MAVTSYRRQDGLVDTHGGILKQFEHGDDNDYGQNGYKEEPFSFKKIYKVVEQTFHC